MPLRPFEVAKHQVGLSNTLLRSAMPRIKLDRALGMRERELVLLHVAIRETKRIL